MLAMKEAKSSIKKVTSHILTTKNKMLRKKSKYDPKYSGKPSFTESVKGNFNFRLRKQLPSLSGIVILLLIGYIAFEQMSKRSRTSIDEGKEIDDIPVVHEKGKLLQDAPIEMLQNVVVDRPVNRQYNPEAQNPKIKGVNDMMGHQNVNPEAPDGQDTWRHAGDNPQPRNNYPENKKFPDPQIRNEYNKQFEDQPGAQGRELWQNNGGDVGDVLLESKIGKPLPYRGEDKPAGKLNDDNSLFQVVERFGERVVPGNMPEDEELQRKREAFQQILQKERDNQQFIPVGQKPKVKYPSPKMFPVDVSQKPTLECEGGPPTLLILVHTEAFHFGVRRAIRETWGVQTEENFPRFHGQHLWKTIFIIGKPGYPQADKEIAKEAGLFHDILQGDFLDTEHENTRKLMLTMSWLYSNIGTCKPKYILKTQDNIFHNMVSIMDWLAHKFTPQSRNIYMGRLLREYQPIRNLENPLFVPVADYQLSKFPPLIEGPLYLFDYESYRLLASHMSQVTPIAMEDGYIGQIAAKVGIRAEHNDHFMLLKLSSNHCHNLRLFFLYDIQPSQHQTIFKENKNARNSDKCKNAHAIEKDGRRVPIEM